MTELFISPINKYTTSTLKTLPLAKLKFYEAGTSTPKEVYADKYKNVSLGSIVTADSAGNFLPIYLDGLYRVELTNSANIMQPQWPVDNVGGSIEFPFDDWSPGATYQVGAFVTETIPGVGTYRYENFYADNINFRPSENPDKWNQIFFNRILTSPIGSAISNPGLTSYTGVTILNGQQFRIEFDSEKAVGILNINSNVNLSGYKDGCYFVSSLGTITQLANPTSVYVVGTPGAGKIGISNDGNRSILIKNNTGFTIESNINILGPGVVYIEDNAP